MFHWSLNKKHLASAPGLGYPGLSSPDVIPVPEEPPILNIGLFNVLHSHYLDPKYRPPNVVAIPRADCNGVGCGMNSCLVPPG